MDSEIDEFLAGRRFAVAGASKDRAKYGNRVLRALVAAGREVIPVHPRESVVEGLAAVATVDELPDGVHGLSIVTPPEVTVSIVEAAIRTGLRRLWMQPGAEEPGAVSAAREAGLTVIAGGPCILVALAGRRD